MLVRIGIAAKILGVCTKTLRRWETKGLLQPTQRTEGGHRRYESTQLKRREKGGVTAPQAEQAATEQVKVPERVIGYVRVSSAKQRDDLERQKKLLQDYAQQQGWTIEVIFQDVASGLNDARQGLRKLLTYCQEGHIDRVLITYDDRLARFGTSLLEWLLTAYHVQLTRVQPIKLPPSLEQQLFEDLLALMTSFTGKFHRLRRGTKVNDISTHEGVNSPATGVVA